mgnify:CR=1 FL=1
MTDEPIKRNWTNTDYQKLIDDMAAFLKLGATLNAAIDDAGLNQHHTAIYDKYRLNDWFAYKIDSLREYPGKLVAYILSKRVIMVNEKIAQGIPVTKDEMEDVRFMAEKHRTAQKYFVTRTETAVADPDKVGKILDTIETDYGKLGQEANRQVVEINPPIQDKGQTGPDSNV